MAENLMEIIEGAGEPVPMEDFYREIAGNFIRERFPQLLQLAGRRRLQGLSISSVGSTGLDNSIYLHALLNFATQVYPNVHMKVVTVVTAFVQSDYASTRKILREAFMLDVVNYEVDWILWIEGFIEENVQKMMTKWGNAVNPFFFTSMMPQPANFYFSNSDEFQENQDLDNTLMNLNTVDSQLVSACGELDLLQTFRTAFFGICKVLRDHFPQVFNPVDIIGPLTKATIPELMDIYVEGEQFSFQRVQKALEFAKQGNGIELVAEKVQNKNFRNTFIANNVTFRSVENLPPLKRLATYRLAKFIKENASTCTMENIQKLLLLYKGYPTLEEQTCIDAHLNAVGKNLEKVLYEQMAATYISLDKNPALQTVDAFVPNVPQQPSTGISEFQILTPLSYITNEQASEAQSIFVRNGGCKHGSIKAGKFLFKTILSLEEKTYSLSSQEAQTNSQYQSKKSEILGLLKEFEIAEIKEKGMEQCWDSMREDHLLQKIFAEGSSQTRNKKK